MCIRTKSSFWLDFVLLLFLGISSSFIIPFAVVLTSYSFLGFLLLIGTGVSYFFLCFRAKNGLAQNKILLFLLMIIFFILSSLSSVFLSISFEQAYCQAHPTLEYCGLHSFISLFFVAYFAVAYVVLTLIYGAFLFFGKRTSS